MDKLERVIDYAHSYACRQTVILDYFGDKSNQRCGTCDVCRPSPRQGAAPQGDKVEVRDGVLQAVRMILSGVARAKRRFGKTMIAQMLCGSQSSKLRKTSLANLSTYGLLDFLSQSDVVSLMDELLSIGLLGQQEKNRHRPLIQLTKRGREVMLGTAPIDDAISIESHLALKLRRLKKQAVIPPSPSSPSASSPPSIESAAPAVGAAELQPSRPGESLRIDEPAAKAADRTEPDERKPKAKAPTEYWTWRLLSQGFSVYECSQIRDIPREVVLDHAIKARSSSLALKADWLWSELQLAELRDREAGVELSPPLEDADEKAFRLLFGPT